MGLGEGFMMENADIREKMQFASMSQKRDFVLKIIMREYEKKANGERPNLIPNIALSKFNQYFGFEYDSDEALQLTNRVNYAIIDTFYKDVIKYDKPTSEFLFDKKDIGDNKTILYKY